MDETVLHTLIVRHENEKLIKSMWLFRNLADSCCFGFRRDLKRGSFVCVLECLQRSSSNDPKFSDK